jgi:peptidoglycan hydrolase-like protein with peptidoglycan-binding domain
MGEVVIAQGARGGLVLRLQQALKGPNAKPDGVYGLETVTAVRDAQTKNDLPFTGEADPVTWSAVTGQPAPPLLDRALQVTAAFEGHGFGLAQGNFDGAGITWGIIGFTLQHGELGRIIQEAQHQDPALVQNAFGSDAGELLRLLALPLPDQLAWADQHSLGRSRALLAEPWRTHFQAFGDQAAVQAIQLRHVDKDYFQPARTTAALYGLTTELGVALCFDIHVQDGGISPQAAAAIESQVDPAASELDRRALIARSVAAAARPSYRSDVLARKRTVATGSGTVHGHSYTLRNWGLDESQA